MNPIDTAPQDVKDRIIELRKMKMSYASISIKVGRPVSYVAAVWRMWMQDLLGTYSDDDMAIRELAEQGKPAPQIAAELGVSVSKVRLVLYQARAYGAINQAHVSSHKAKDPSKRRNDISWRDYEVWRRYKLGVAGTNLSTQFQVTSARIYQIIADVSARIAYLETLDPAAIAESARHVLFHASTLTQLPEYAGPSEE